MNSCILTHSTPAGNAHLLKISPYSQYATMPNSLPPQLNPTPKSPQPQAEFQKHLRFLLQA